MNYILPIAIVAIVVYVLIAARLRWWPWPVKASVGVSATIFDREFDRLGIPRPVFAYDYLTPLLARVRSVVPVPDAALQAIDEGIENQITRHNAAHPTWARGRQHSEYAVLFINPMATNVENDPGSPALLVQGTQAAGTCIGDGDILTHIVLPHQQDSQWSHIDYLMHSAWNESEHCRENWNDYAVYMSYTGANDVHPHVP